MDGDTKEIQAMIFDFVNYFLRKVFILHAGAKFH
jgi:hypothetical protein